MRIVISESMATVIGKEKLTHWGLQKDAWSWRQKGEIDLSEKTAQEVKELQELLISVKEKSSPLIQKSIRVILRNVTSWLEAITGKAGQQKAKTGHAFEKLLVRYLADSSGYRVYFHEDNDVKLFYYVIEVRYISPDRYTPEHVNMRVAWEELGGIQEETVVFWESDYYGITVVEALGKKNYFAETTDTREAYLKEIESFGKICKRVGEQFWATGIATDDVDGNREKEDRWYWHQIHTLQMERDGEPTRVVLDVFYEDDTSKRKEKHIDLQRWFWERVEKGKHDPEDEGGDSASSSDLDSPEKIEVPIHPMLVVFDFKKHLRLRIHVNYLADYVYDEKMGEKLILPDEIKSLVEMLVEHRGTDFQDIVRGKSGGAVVLLTGPPGVGKTLTAEVFSESEKRALYSVQCSQLGTTPDDLEGELLKVFARCRRWGAVLLLDEADVYVRERGSDLNQNAIVGVFLRVIEYQSSILFLTTNRPEDVDDAIASRCIARIDYPKPDEKQQARIWEVLSRSSKIELPEKTIREIVKANPDVTGRDIKNLLKLAHLISLSRGKKITSESVEFVRKFKPTISSK